MFNWLLFILIYLPFQIALNPGANFDLASIRVFIVLLFVVWLWKHVGFLKPHKIPQTLHKNLQSICLSVFLILTGLSLLNAENIFWGLRKLVFFLSIFPLYFLVVGLVNNWPKIKKIILTLTIGGGLIAIIGLFQFLFQFIFGLEKVYSFWGINIVPIFSGFNFGALLLAYPSWLVNISGQTIMRAFSLFSDPHMLSFYIGLILPLAIVLLYWTVRENQAKFSIFNFQFSVIFVSCFMLCVTCLLTFTRGAYLAIIITFLVLAVLIWKYLDAKKIALFLCFSLLIFIIPITPISDRFYSSFDLSEGSNLGRLEMWQQAGQVGWQHAWWGVGLGNYSLALNSNLGYRSPITAHNLYLDLFSEGGFFVLMIWLILILGTISQLFWRLKEVSDNKEQSCILVGLIGSLVYFSVHSFFETAIYNPIVLAVLMVILGMSTVVIKSKTTL